VLEAHPLLADADGIHEPGEGRAEGQRTEGDGDGGELLHGHDHGLCRDGAPCLPNDRDHAPHQEGDLDQYPIEGA